MSILPLPHIQGMTVSDSFILDFCKIAREINKIVLGSHSLQGSESKIIWGNLSHFSSVRHVARGQWDHFCVCFEPVKSRLEVLLVKYI